MTSDYYINLANYYTNQLVNEAPAETITFNNTTYGAEITNLLDDEAQVLKTKYSGNAYSYSYRGSLRWEKSDNTIVYGNFEVLNSSSVTIATIGFMMVLSTTNQPLALIDTYTGGTQLNEISVLKVNDDGTLYGVEQIPNNPRLVFIGNVFTSLKADFKIAYNFEHEFNVISMIKKENTGEYLFIGDNYGYLSGYIAHLIINYGASPTWNYYHTNNIDFGSYVDYSISWGENIDLTIYGENETNNIMYITEYFFDGTTISQGDSIEIASNYLLVQSLKGTAVGNKVYYVCTSDNNNVYTIKVGKADFSNNTNTYIYTSPNNTKGFAVNCNKESNFVWFTYTISTTYTYGFGVIKDDNVYIKEEQGSPGYNLLITSYIAKKYNIIQINLLWNDEIERETFLLHETGYTGTPYKYTNMFIPYSINIYDYNSILLFSRDIYNMNVYNNVTESRFNVPYTMINDIAIGQEDLYGVTNYKLVSSSKYIKKNKYENLMINFFNSIVVSDYTGRIYNSGGARVNNSISKTNDMSNASARKLKIFYSDNTTAIQTLNAPTITGSGNPMTITYETTIYVDSLGSVLKYQILSNDEQTLYFEYDMSLVDTGMYKITQNCSVE